MVKGDWDTLWYPTNNLAVVEREKWRESNRGAISLHTLGTPGTSFASHLLLTLFFFCCWPSCSHHQRSMEDTVHSQRLRRKKNLAYFFPHYSLSPRRNLQPWRRRRRRRKRGRKENKKSEHLCSLSYVLARVDKRQKVWRVHTS